MKYFFEGARDALGEIRDGGMEFPKVLMYVMFVPLFIVGFFWCLGEVVWHRTVRCPRGEHVAKSLIKGRESTCLFCGAATVSK